MRDRSRDKLRLYGKLRRLESGPSCSKPSPEILRSKSHEHRLGLEVNAPCFPHTALNFLLQRDDVARFRLAAIHERERVFVRDSGGSVFVSFTKAGAFDQPCRGNLMLRVKRRIRWR